MRRAGELAEDHRRSLGGIIRERAERRRLGDEMASTKRASILRLAGLALAIPALTLGAVGCGGEGATTSPAAAESAQAPTTPSAQQAVDAFVAAGLPAESVRAMTRDDYGMAPYVGEGLRFLIPSLGADAGGRVFTGAQSDLVKLKDYYDNLGRESAAFFSWIFLNEPAGVLVQINGDLPGAEAAKYEDVVRAL